MKAVSLVELQNRVAHQPRPLLSALYPLKEPTLGFVEMGCELIRRLIVGRLDLAHGYQTGSMVLVELAFLIAASRARLLLREERVSPMAGMVEAGFQEQRRWEW